MSEEAMRAVEATAAGAALYRLIWKPLRTMLLPVIVILLGSVSMTKMQTSEASLFAHRILPCLPKVRMQQSPEPEKTSPEREATQFGSWQAS
jgi:hypothetical protein